MDNRLKISHKIFSAFQNAQPLPNELNSVVDILCVLNKEFPDIEWSLEVILCRLERAERLLVAVKKDIESVQELMKEK